MALVHIVMFEFKPNAELDDIKDVSRPELTGSTG